MLSLRPVYLCVMLAIPIIGCEKFTDPPKPASTATTSKAPNESVALPSNALPPSDAAINVAPPSPASGDPSSTSSQASPKELSKQQESTAMPMPGQVNNHSTPEPLDKKK